MVLILAGSNGACRPWLADSAIEKLSYTFAEMVSETLKKGSVDSRGFARWLTVRPVAFQSKVLGMYWMM